MMRRLLAAGCAGVGAGVSGVFYFSPGAAELAARRRKLLGLSQTGIGQTGSDADEGTVAAALKEHARALGNPTGLFRFAFAAGTVATVAWEYNQLRRRRDRECDDWHWLSGAGLGGADSPEYRAARAGVHSRSAERVFALCHRLGGVYTKMGQYVATLNHLLPETWTSTLSQLQDHAASHPLDDELRAMLEDELGMPLETAFVEFDREPLAAASLAQVHRAVIRSPSRCTESSLTSESADNITTPDEMLEVAVKLQYPRLGPQVVGDLWAMQVLANAVGFFFEEFEYAWLLPEFEQTADMELDFRQEANNSRRAKSMLASRSDTHIPFVIDSLSSRRVMTMEFVRGHRIDDAVGMRNDGIEPLNVATTVADVFGEMIYRHGFIHCDPHPGNLLVRKKKSGYGFELVLLDHGMYRRLEQPFRRAHCMLWKSLLTRDADLGSRTMSALGLDEIGYETLSIALTFRTPRGNASVGGRMSDAERQDLKDKYKGVTAGDINRFMQSLPRDMLFVLRTNDIVRSLNKSLGGTSRSRFITMGEWAVRGLAVENVGPDGGGDGYSAPASWPPSSRARAVNKLVDSERRRMLTGGTAAATTWALGRMYTNALQIGDVLLLHARLWLLDKYLSIRWWWFGHVHGKRKKALG